MPYFKAASIAGEDFERGIEIIEVSTGSRISMLVTRIFLGLVGLVYLYLAAWCSLKPEQTSQLVGFELKPGSGQSEFLVIYGGLELALGLVFLWPLLRPEQLKSMLLVCLIVHACIVTFRSISFGMYSGIQPMTRSLAFYEWLIFIGSAVLVYLESRVENNHVKL